MKILMLSWEYPPHMVGGLGQHVYDISRFLVQQGVEVHIITPRVKGYPDQENNNGVYIHRVGHPTSEANIDNFKCWTFTFNSEAIREAVRLHSKVGGFNVVHAHDWLAAYAGRAVSKTFEIPLVTTIHATEHGRNLGLHTSGQRQINEIENNLALEADQIICCSQYMQDEICSLFGVQRRMVKIIPNGVDPQQFKTLPDELRMGITPQEKAIVFLGRLVPEKGIWQLINSFAKVRESIADAKLYIGGRGPQKAILEERVAELGLADRVVFTGFLKEKERNYIYDRASVAVFPSLYEPFGIVALEAMATRTPVVVSDIGGLAEIVKHRKTGLKVPAGNEAALCEAIIEMLKDQRQAKQMVENAYEEVNRIYSWEAIAKSTRSVYENALVRTKKKREVG